MVGGAVVAACEVLGAVRGVVFACKVRWRLWSPGCGGGFSDSPGFPQFFANNPEIGRSPGEAPENREKTRRIVVVRWEPGWWCAHALPVARVSPAEALVSGQLQVSGPYLTG